MTQRPKPYVPLLASLVSLTSFVSAVGQSVPLALEVPAKDRIYEIDTLSELTSERSVLLDGQPMEGRFGGGGGSASPTTTTQHVVFTEGGKGPQWRRYDALTASATRDDRDGNPQTQSVNGALQGKTVFFDRASGSVVFRDGAADGSVLEERAVAGLPTATDLAGLAPGRATSVGATFELGDTFQAAIKNLMHPVRAAVEPRPEATEAEPENPGRRGGGGGRGGAGRGGARAPRGINDVALRTLVNTQLLCRVSGKLVSIEKVDGKDLAIVTLTGSLTGEGDPAELGMAAMGGAGGGRGGRGGGGGGAAPAMEGTASVDMGFEGRLVLDVASKAIVQLSLKGALQSRMESSRSMTRGEETRELTMTSSTKGSFALTVLSY